MKGLNLRYIYFFSDLKGKSVEKRKSSCVVVSLINAGPVQKAYSSAIQYR